MKWISVEDKLPETKHGEAKKVLVVGGEFQWEMIEIAEYMKSYGFTVYHDEFSYSPKPTHWMPLPEPPETE